MNKLYISLILIFFTTIFIQQKNQSINLVILKKISTPLLYEIIREISYGIIESIPRPIIIYNLRNQSNIIEKIYAFIKLTFLFYFYIKKYHSNHTIQINLRVNPFNYNCNITYVKYLRKIGNFIGILLAKYFKGPIYNLDQKILNIMKKLLLRFLFNNIFIDGHIDENETCGICLENNNVYSSGITICKHTFHKNCIKEWLFIGKFNCPTCRTYLYNQNLEMASANQI